MILRDVATLQSSDFLSGIEDPLFRSAFLVPPPVHCTKDTPWNPVLFARNSFHRRGHSSRCTHQMCPFTLVVDGQQKVFRF
eukprot:NODE_3697_length_894_cov_4.547929_g3076_i0.p3 GENE.NODE_3697_length_894_cov_4.547929_g3076_i0~~NODE_3697_length_894_cov_4.547929_g3076_i0.p3  ORF type:complete len:81 (-),score=7.00 NODE_3697_length_894_cov_4.547929_g3076_i0:178-420(-)